MEALAALLPSLVQLAAEAPGVIAQITGHRTDEEAIAHARAVLAAAPPLSERFHELVEERRRQHRADEITQRIDLPKPSER